MIEKACAVRLSRILANILPHLIVLSQASVLKKFHVKCHCHQQRENEGGGGGGRVTVLHIQTTKEGKKNLPSNEKGFTYITLVFSLQLNSA